MGPQKLSAHTDGTVSMGIEGICPQPTSICLADLGPEASLVVADDSGDLQSPVTLDSPVVLAAHLTLASRPIAVLDDAWTPVLSKQTWTSSPTHRSVVRGTEPPGSVFPLAAFDRA